MVLRAALLSLPLAACAPLQGTAVLPPEPFYTAAVRGLEANEYAIEIVPGFAISRACLGQSEYACAVALCVIYVRSDLRERADYPTIILHEAAHCEGWPAYHPGVPQ